MVKYKNLIIIAILSITIAASFGFPQKKYQSFDIIEYLDIPLSFNDWSGRVVINKQKTLGKKFNFINKSKQFYFWKKDGSEVYFSLLNAGNFHNPKVCYTGIGYKPQYDGTYNVKLTNSSVLQFDTYLMLKENNNFLTTYWMCIDGKKVNWLSQKLNELICSLTGRKSINLLTRIDIPTDPDNTNNALTLTKKFIHNLYETLDQDKKVYIFGR